MRVLIIKTSSLGDVIHTFPALTDLVRAHPEAHIDWVVEEAFKDLPKLHPSVKNVIVVAWRRWRKNIFSREHHKEFLKFWKQLRAQRYDYVIDAQGLIKSALISLATRGPSFGYGFRSAREAWASLFYRHRVPVSKEEHAIARLRLLFSKVFSLPEPQTFNLDYGLSRATAQTKHEGPLVFFHSTSWASKLWPETHWQSLILHYQQQGFEILLPSGNADEYARAQRLAAAFSSHVRALEPCSLSALAALLANARGVVSVDTGLGHLAAALDIPTLMLYGATHPGRTGAVGRFVKNIAATTPCSPCLARQCRYLKDSENDPPCMETLKPQSIQSALSDLMERASHEPA